MGGLHASNTSALTGLEQLRYLVLWPPGLPAARRGLVPQVYRIIGFPFPAAERHCRCRRDLGIWKRSRADQSVLGLVNDFSIPLDAFSDRAFRHPVRVPRLGLGERVWPHRWRRLRNPIGVRGCYRENVQICFAWTQRIVQRLASTGSACDSTAGNGISPSAISQVAGPSDARDIRRRFVPAGRPAASGAPIGSGTQVCARTNHGVSGLAANRPANGFATLQPVYPFD